jgi:serine/threonine protein kinase
VLEKVIIEIIAKKFQQSLKEFIDDNGPLTPFNALLLAKNVATALAFMHANGLVHCNIDGMLSL